MLKVSATRKSIPILILLIVLAGCGRIWKPRPIKLDVIPPPFLQTLVVENQSSGSISVLPSSGSQAQPLVIAPGESAEIEFTVERLAERDRSGSPKTTTWTARVKEDSPYVGMTGTDGVLKVEGSGGEERSYQIALGTCWFENNPPNEEHELIVGEEEPAEGIPALRLCE